MPCCPNCFGDPGLTKNVIPSLTTGDGNCPYCHSQGVPLVEPSALNEAFTALVGIYEPNADGRALVQWLRDDWRLFVHPEMDDIRSRDLLAQILGDGDIVQQTFVPAARFETDRLIHWEALREELMHVNRYFPDSPIDKDRLTELLEYLISDDVPTDWFRSRVEERDQQWPLDQMGPPPPWMASNGRANPPGIPYLYLGSTADTAVAEIRPHTGQHVTVAHFQLPADLLLIDLRDPKFMISPFDFQDEDQLGSMRSDVAFLDRLGEELTRPVLPQGAAIDYVPSQFLCEFIKKAGFDGVLYRSAVGDGMNLALFDPPRAQGIGVESVRVRRVTVEIE